MKLWQILAVVAAGIVCGIFEPGRFTYALGHATLFVFLPPLLFEAAWNLNYRAIVRQWPAIATLAGPGVILTALVVAGTLTVVRVPFGAALLTGAILSATDPIAVVAIFRRLKVPKTLVTIVECESLFNDAVAVLFYRAVLAGLAVGTGAVNLALVSVVAIGGALGGIVFGVALAYVLARILRGTHGASAQIAATAICAYGSYFAADSLHLSGIFATIAAGIAIRYFERRRLTLKVADDVVRFWEIVAVAANAGVFFLVGSGLQIARVAREPIFVVACIVAIALARMVVAGLLLPGGYPREWLDVIRVAGIRGALSLALAVALPAGTPYRGAIIDATFAVALATLVAGALTATRVVERVARARERG